MNFLKKLLKRRSVILILVIVAAGGGYAIYRNAAAKPAATRYVTSAAVKQSLTVSISGTGQVSSIDQVDISPNASGTIVYLAVSQGQSVAAGQLLASIDSRTAQRTVSDAQTSLETAKLNLQKALEPTDSLTKLQQENSLISAQNSLQKSKDDLAKAYDDGFTAVSNAFLDLPTVMTGLQDIIMSNNANGSQWNIDFYADAVKSFDAKATDYREDAYQAYLAARKDYDQNFSDYKSASRTSDQATITALISETHATSLAIAEAVKDANNLIQFYEDKLTERNLRPIALADTQLASLGSYTGVMNGNISSLFSSKRTIETDKQLIDDATRSIAEKQATIDKTNAGTDALELRSLEISIQQKKNALQDAKDKLADYSVRAPFAGVIADVKIKKGDTVSAGSNVATIISPQQVAEISLNEMDVAKIKTGQKATVAFDAIENLSLSGAVAQVDTIGSVSQGVVSYGVSIAFDTQDERVKSGMSVAAAIITDFKSDVITVPSTAVKTQNGETYVLVMAEGAKQPTRTPVSTGLANDTDTEIVSGVKEGDLVVTQTITASSSSSGSSSSNRTTGNGVNLRDLTGGTGGPPGM